MANKKKNELMSFLKEAHPDYSKKRLGSCLMTLQKYIANWGEDLGKDVYLDVNTSSNEVGTELMNNLYIEAANYRLSNERYKKLDSLLNTLHKQGDCLEGKMCSEEYKKYLNEITVLGQILTDQFVKIKMKGDEGN